MSTNPARRDAPLLVLAELDRLAQHLDPLFAPLLTLKHPHRPNHAPHKPPLDLVALLEPLLAQLGQQLLELADRVVRLAREVPREGADGAGVEGRRDAREELGCRGGGGRGQGEVGARGVEGQEGRRRRVLVVGCDRVAVRACVISMSRQRRDQHAWCGRCSWLCEVPLRVGDMGVPEAAKPASLMAVRVAGVLVGSVASIRAGLVP